MEDVKKPRIILAVKDKKRKDAYLAVLNSLAECIVFESLKDIPSFTGRNPYNGILIDITLNLKSTYLEKVQIFDSLHAMPSATLNLSAKTGSIKLFMTEERYGTARTLEEFAMVCTVLEPKILYQHNRVALHLNALLSPSSDFELYAERTFTLNVSNGGCFLFTTDQSRYRPQETVWIDFMGLANRNPIMGKVCWKREWGVSYDVPGIGISFEFILDSQHKEIQTLIALKKQK